MNKKVKQYLLTLFLSVSLYAITIAPLIRSIPGIDEGILGGG